MYFKNVISAVGHTPLVELAQSSVNKRVRILAKLEGQNVGGSASIKDRIARYMIERAEKSGELTRDKTIVEATSGNTGIALAWLGHKLGYKVTIVMPDSMSPERRQLIQIFGAELILTPGAQGVNGAIKVARELAAGGDKYYLPDQFSNPANPQAHYETTGAEIINDFPYNRIDVLVAGIGTGGTITGTSRRLKEKYPKIKVVGVEPPLGDSIQGLKCLEEYMPPVLDLSLVDERAVVTSNEAAIAAKQLLDREGIFAGLSSGAVIHWAIKASGEMDSGNIVVLLPDVASITEIIISVSFAFLDLFQLGFQLLFVFLEHTYIFFSAGEIARTLKPETKGREAESKPVPAPIHSPS